jgi:hypothetical protein
VNVKCCTDELTDRVADKKQRKVRNFRFGVVLVMELVSIGLSLFCFVEVSIFDDQKSVYEDEEFSCGFNEMKEIYDVSWDDESHVMSVSPLTKYFQKHSLTYFKAPFNLKFVSDRIPMIWEQTFDSLCSLPCDRT